MNKRGSILVVTILLVVVLALLGGMTSGVGINEAMLGRRYLESAKAFWAADAGIQLALWDIKNNKCRGMKSAATGGACRDCGPCGTGMLRLTGVVPGAEFAADYDPSLQVIYSTGWTPSALAPVAERKLKLTGTKKVLFGRAAFSQDGRDADYDPTLPGKKPPAVIPFAQYIWQEAE